MMRTSFFVRMCGSVLSAAFVIGLIGTYYFKPLYNDGSLWALNVLHHQNWHMPYGYLRYTTLIPQTPAVLLSMLKAPPWLITWLFSIGYFIYPYLALGGLFFKYKNHPKNSVLLIPLLTLFLSIFPNWAFGVSIVNEAIVIFSILFSYVILTEKPKTWIITLFGLGLFFSYESSFIFYFLVLFILWREKKLTVGNLSSLMVLACAQLINLFFFILPYNRDQHFRSSFFESLKSPHLMMLLGIFGLCAYLLIDKKYLRKLSLLLIVMVSGVTSWIIFQQSALQLWQQSYVDRVWAIPACFLITFLIYEVLKKRSYVLTRKELLISLIPILPALFFESRLTFDRIKLSSRMQRLISDMPGCHVLSMPEWQVLKGNSFMPEWTVPHHAILQARSETINSVLFVDSYYQDGSRVPNDFCSLQEGKYLSYKDQYSHLMLNTHGRLNFNLHLNRLQE